MSDVLYEVEISRTKQKVFVILFNKVGMIGEQYPVKLMHKWLEESGNYEDVVSLFAVKFGKLVRISEQVQ